VNGKDVLDAGCGHGWYAEWLARNGARIVAVDRSRDMVMLARERLGGRARNKRRSGDIVRVIRPSSNFTLRLYRAKARLKPALHVDAIVSIVEPRFTFGTFGEKLAGVHFWRQGI
jgi:SAM-dependent methyltransferase